MSVKNKPAITPVVLVATGVMDAGGAESLIMEILRNKTGRVNYVLLVHRKPGDTPGIYNQEISSLGIPIFYIHSVGSVGIKRYCREFKEAIHRIGDVDIIHIHLNGVGGIIARAAQKAGINRRIVHCHANITFEGSIFTRIFNEIKLAYFKMQIADYATDKWACSKEAGTRLFGSNADYIVIPNVIDVSHYLPSETKTVNEKKAINLDDKLIIGSVGRIARVKNYELALHIIAELRLCGINACFVCFGRVVDDEYFTELNKLSDRLGISQSIHFMGNSDNIAQDMSYFDVFIMPSISEGFGMAALEAQAAGLPVLVSSGVSRLIDMQLDTVKFLPLNNVSNWVDSIKNAQKCKLSNQEIFEAFRKKGYDSETAVESIENLYLEIAKREL